MTPLPREMSAAEYRAGLRGESKYRNEPVTIDGIRFDSQAEARRYGELVLLARAGQISALRCHPAYELQAAFRDAQGRRHGALRYEGDFEYREGAVLVVEDVKGVRTAVFRIKEKLFRFRYPEIDLRVLEVSS